MTDQAEQEVGWETLYCSKCGYQLTGLAKNGNCPECAEPIASAISRANFFKRDASRLYWTCVGLILVAVSFAVELLWALVYGVSMLCELILQWRSGFNGWAMLVSFVGPIRGFNSLIAGVAPGMAILGCYYLFYGITQVNRTGKAVGARVALIVIFGIYAVTTLSGLGVILMHDVPEVVSLGLIMGYLSGFPFFMSLLVGVGTVLLLVAMRLACERMSVPVPGWADRLAKLCAFVLIVLAGVGAGVDWWLGPLGSSINPSAPGWSYTVTGGPVPAASQLTFDDQRWVSDQQVYRSATVSGRALFWVNLSGAWVGSYFHLHGTSYTLSKWNDTFGVRWARGRYSYGLWGTSAMQNNVLGYGGSSPASVTVWFWPEMLWCAIGLLASGYLTLFIAVNTGRLLWRIRVVMRESRAQY